MGIFASILLVSGKASRESSENGSPVSLEERKEIEGPTGEGPVLSLSP